MLISASTGEDVTASLADDPMREGMVLMQGVFSQIEKKRLVLKLRKAREAKRKEHGRCEGVKPYGTRPGEAEILDSIRTLSRKPRCGERLTCQAIADRLNAEGKPTRKG